MSADLDKQIDRAVREMLDVEPPADLRARVVFQVERRQRTASSFQLPAFGWVLGSLAAAAVVLLVVLPGLKPRPASAPATIAQVEPTPGPMPGPTSEAGLKPRPTSESAGAGTSEVVGRGPRPGVQGLSRGDVGRGSDPGTQLADGTANAAVVETVTLEPMRPLAPISVAPVAQTSIAPEQLAMSPLKPIADLQIAPLSPPGGRH